MKYKVLLFFIFCLGNLVVHAQTEDVATAVKKINAIKKDAKYLYAESTTSDWEQAYENAKALLDSEIEAWVKEQSKGKKDSLVAEAKGYVARINNQVMEVKTRRGNLFRVFVYIQKNNIMTYTDDDDFLVTSLVDNVEQGKTETIAETKTETGAIAETKAVSGTESVVETIADDSSDLSEEEKAFLALRKPQEIEPFLKKYTCEYGKLATLPKLQYYYVVVFAKESIVAYLKLTSLAHVDANGKSIPMYNLGSKQMDELNDYRGKGWGAIWFIFK